MLLLGYNHVIRHPSPLCVTFPADDTHQLILPDLPQSPGWLPHWQLFIAITALFNTIQNYTTLKLTRRVYNNASGTSLHLFYTYFFNFCSQQSLRYKPEPSEHGLSPRPSCEPMLPTTSTANRSFCIYMERAKFKSFL